MPRDYAHRSPAKKKQGAKSNNKRGSKAKKQPERAQAPWFMILAVILLISGAIYFLFNISGSADTAKNAPAKIELDPKPPAKTNRAATTESKPLPKKPEQERWSYMKELENREVHVEVEEKPQNTRPYQMQCGSFRVKSQADELKARIAFSGLQSTVRRTEGKSGVWYRVVLGPYPTKRKAEADKHILKRDRIRGCQIWHWN